MKNFSVKQKKLLLVILSLFIVLASLNFIPTEYYFMSPGPPYQWDIEYGDVENYSFDGNPVSYTHLTLPTILLV